MPAQQASSVENSAGSSDLENQVNGSAGARDEKGGSNAASNRLAQLDSAKDSVCQQISTISDKISSLAPKNGTLGKAGQFATDNLNSVSSYLQSHSTADIGGEVLSVVRSHPVRVIGSAIGAGIGYMVARRIENRFMSSSDFGSDSGAQASATHLQNEDGPISASSPSMSTSGVGTEASAGGTESDSAESMQADRKKRKRS
jgi:hypothetical protein